MTGTTTTLIKLPRNRLVDWPKGWPETVGLLVDQAAGALRLWHSSENNAAILKRLASDGMRDVAIFEPEDPDDEMDHSLRARDMLKRNEDLLEEAEDLDMSLDFMVTEGLSGAKTASADVAKTADPESNGHGCEGPEDTWHPVGDARIRHLVSRGTITAFGNGYIFMIDGLEAPAGDLAVIPDEELQIAAHGRELRFPAALCAPASFIPAGALVFPPAAGKVLDAVLTSDGDHAYLQINPFARIGQAAPEGVRKTPETAAGLPADPEQSGKKAKARQGTKGLILGTVMLAASVYALMVFQEPRPVAAKDPVSSIRQSLFKSQEDG